MRESARERAESASPSTQGVGARVGNGRGELMHGCQAQATRHPLGHFREHLASDGVDMVGSQFGLVLGRIRHWAKNEVYSPRLALHF